MSLLCCTRDHRLTWQVSGGVTSNGKPFGNSNRNVVFWQS